MTPRRLIHPRFALLMAMLAVGAAFLTWGATPPSDKEAPKESYAGSEACAVCHDEHAAKFDKTNPHANVPTSWGVTGCESCHGPGQAHVDGEGDKTKIRRFSELKGNEASEVCLKCHERGDHKLFAGSAHDSRDVGCTKCHSVHSPEREKTLLAAKSEFDLCTSCHLKKKASLLRSSHMPFREGAMTCSSCHNPHGGIGPTNLKQVSVNDNCYSCHAEKRAPMLWEHAPVKESCLNCHDPHGSIHQSLLTTKRPRLCQQCHDEASHPATAQASADDESFYPSKQLFNKSCTNCHTQVHGSNHPAGVRFVR